MFATIVRAHDTATLYLVALEGDAWAVARVQPSGQAPDPHICQLAGCVLEPAPLLAWAAGRLRSDELLRLATMPSHLPPK